MLISHWFWYSVSYWFVDKRWGEPRTCLNFMLKWQYHIIQQYHHIIHQTGFDCLSNHLKQSWKWPFVCSIHFIVLFFPNKTVLGWMHTILRFPGNNKPHNSIQPCLALLQHHLAAKIQSADRASLSSVLTKIKSEWKATACNAIFFLYCINLALDFGW